MVRGSRRRDRFVPGDDVLAVLPFPRELRAKLHGRNPLERLNKEVKRRADVVGVVPNEAAAVRLAGAVLPEQSNEWAMCRRSMPLEALAPFGDAERAVPAAIAAA